MSATKRFWQAAGVEKGGKRLLRLLKRRALALQVMYAENLQVRPGGKGTPPLVPSRSLSARSDSTSSILQPRAGMRAGMHPGVCTLHAALLATVRRALLPRRTAPKMQPFPSVWQAC